MSVPELRKEVLRQCDILQAILAFNYQFSEDSRRFLSEIRLRAPTAHARNLRNIRDTLHRDIAAAARTFQLKENPKKFAEWFKENSRNELGQLQMPKFLIDSQMFGRFGGDTKGWQKYPHHAYIALDFEGAFKVGGPEYYLPEAALYEDMCAAFNLAMESQHVMTQRPIVKVSVKKHYLYRRAAVLSAFYFVEAYLNGLAFDYWWNNKEKVSTEESDILTEWNSAKAAAQWRNFRTKALQYPRLILGSKHPPLTETNSPSLNILLTDGKDIRDAIVHQNPRLEADGTPVKVRWLVQLRLTDVAKIVDAAVGFVKQLNPVLGDYAIKLHWIHSRGEDGLFPTETFD
jgi:hypothetical protein